MSIVVLDFTLPKLSQPFQCEDVCRRQILTYKDDPRTEKIEILLMSLEP